MNIANGSYPFPVGGTEYLASVLTDRDYDDLNLFLQQRYVAKAMLLAEGMSNGDRLIQIAIAGAFTIEWGTREANNIIATTDGLIRLGWQMIRARHSKITLEEFTVNAKRDLEKYLKTVYPTYKQLHQVEDAGGSSTENTKSTES